MPGARAPGCSVLRPCRGALLRCPELRPLALRRIRRVAGAYRRQIFRALPQQCRFQISAGEALLALS